MNYWWIIQLRILSDNHLQHTRNEAREANAPEGKRNTIFENQIETTKKNGDSSQKNSHPELGDSLNRPSGKLNLDKTSDIVTKFHE